MTSTTSETSETITTASETLTSTTASTGTHLTSTTTTDGEKSSETPEPDNGKDNKAGVVAGAVVGSLAGVGLIIAALILGYRLGKKNAANDTKPSGLRETIRTLPRPKVTLSWAKPPPDPNHTTVQQPNLVEIGGVARGSNLSEFQDSWRTHELGGLARENDTGTPVESGGIVKGTNAVELESSGRAQGWATTDYQPAPYEMGTSMPPQEPGPRGNY